MNRLHITSATSTTTPNHHNTIPLPSTATKDSLTVLLMTHILPFLPTCRQYSLVCCAGSKGYHALKEMLQTNTSGNTLLIESGDFSTATTTITQELIVSAPPSRPCPSDTGGSGVVVNQQNGIATSPSSSSPSPVSSNNTHNALWCPLYRFERWDGLPDYWNRIPEHVSHVIVYSNLREGLPTGLLSDCHRLTSVDNRVIHVTTGNTKQ
eukprot:TRINITY_DN6739_c0_g2_i1.p1 TRINITY_DN6739_c0_g2~~TRINITY_DN6739_c0_g2_i1.p1  ORF type:complete len:209 (-),score=15.15 TRINITY_DN6739_c0_g2_i1:245-871(-)